MSIYSDQCTFSPEIEQAVNACSPEILKYAISHLMAWGIVSPDALERAARRGAQCRHWRMADKAWAEYEALNAQMKDMEVSPLWFELLAKKEKAADRSQEHRNWASELWSAGT